MNRRIYAASRLFALVGLLSFQLANATSAEDDWYFAGCVPTPSECKYSCPRPQFYYELGGATCNAKDYHVRYACFCWGTLEEAAVMGR